MPRIIGLALLTALLSSPACAFIAEKDIASLQGRIGGMSAGEKIALWAEKFVGTPYDPDPLGQYVTKAAIVADERVDCMYLAFRAVELALSNTPEEAVEAAIEKRFLTKGILKDGRVLNYDERYQYGEDMLDGGRWGREITGELSETVEIKGSRCRETVKIIPKERLQALINSKEVRLASGDIVFFIKAPEKRVVGEIVGHIGIIKVEDGTAYLIHASGRKGVSDPLKIDGAGSVKKVLFSDYVESMRFIGIRVSRF